VSVSPFFWGKRGKSRPRAFTPARHDFRRASGTASSFSSSRRGGDFAVIGDTKGIHEKVGQEFWDRLAATLSVRFRAGKVHRGVGRGDHGCGDQLAAYFPYDRRTDVNELPDEIDFGNG